MAVSTVILSLVILATGTPNGDREKTQARDYTHYRLADLGLKPVPETKDPKTGFVMAGKNATALIQKLPEINEKRIPELEKRMGPGGLTKEGFLRTDEKLLDVLAADNKRVVDEWGLTHQELATPLILLGELGYRETVERGKKDRAAGGGPVGPSWGPEILYHGSRLRLQTVSRLGYLDSPFADGTKANTDATVWNLDNGKKLKFSLLIPQTVSRYGFYGGPGTSLWVEPRQIVEVLPFLGKMKKKG